MTDDFWADAEVISVYTDEQGIDDGIIFPVNFGIINRVTGAVLDEFAVNGECYLAKFNVFMDKAIKEFDLLRQKKDDWFYEINIEGKRYFIVENGSSHFTLMKPEDY